MTSAPTPFRIAVPDEVLVDLRDRLARTRWPSHGKGMSWNYGAEIDYLRSLADYWRDGYDWRERERALNALPHFRAEIEGLNIHFVHVRCGVPGALPLALIHGWPSSYLEMVRLIPFLTTPDANGVAYDVVIPSLPGYGFSDWPAASGFAYRDMARIFATLLCNVLGYRRYGLHGSDVGGFVIGWMGVQDQANSVAGIHTMQPGSPIPDPSHFEDDPLTAEEKAYVAAGMAWEAEHGAYAHLQRTRPQALAVGLADSPMGLAAWIVEKLRSWSDCGGDLESRFARDDILDLLTIYWATETAPSSLRSYYERVHFDALLQRDEVISAPSAVTVPIDRSGQPPHWAPPSFARRIHRVRQWTDLPRGGHFASWEEPEAVATAMRRFFDTLGSGEG